MGGKVVRTHKVLVVIICEEELQAAGPVAAPHQQPEHALLRAHVAVPRVLFDGCVSRALTHQEVHALHAETPEGHRRSLMRASADLGPRTEVTLRL